MAEQQVNDLQKCPLCGSVNIEENTLAPGVDTCRDCGEDIEDD